jgi:ParB family chromosome partitioning protein
MSANNKRGLGKGLGALITSTTTSAQKDAAMITSQFESQKLVMFSGKTIVSLNITDVVPNPRQPRHTFKDDSLVELAQSIKEHGVAQPLLVRKKGDKYELIAGERRLRASKLAGLTKVPAVVKDMSDEESLEIAIIENVQREDLNAMDQAESYYLLMKEFNLTQEEVAKKVGKSRSAIANTVRLMELPAEIKESLRTEQITEGHARAILSAGQLMDQLRLWEKIKSESLNVRDAEKIASKNTKPKNSSEIPHKQYALISVQQELSTKFQTKVEINGSEQKGEIRIKYFSKDDLDRIYTLILNNQVI